MNKYELKRLIEKLEDVRNRSTMETANFLEDHEFIKEKTRLWRATWITIPLDEVIEELKAMVEGSYP